MDTAPSAGDFRPPGAPLPVPTKGAGRGLMVGEAHRRSNPGHTSPPGFAAAKLLPGSMSFSPITGLGESTDAILAAASDCAADLIVIGGHGRDGILHAVLGSVAEAVMRHTPGPVLVQHATRATPITASDIGQAAHTCAVSSHSPRARLRRHD